MSEDGSNGANGANKSNGAPSATAATSAAGGNGSGGGHALVDGTTAVLVVTHGDAGDALLNEARRLLGDFATRVIETLPTAVTESRDQIRTRIDVAVRRLDMGRGVLVLVDLQGSTPCNCAVQVKQSGANVEILCGLSLPMLVKVAASDRARMSPAELAHEAAQTAIRSIRLGEGGSA
jgi:mannose/fructose-specific phosphotransferase system component IIA